MRMNGECKEIKIYLSAYPPSAYPPSACPPSCRDRCADCGVFIEDSCISLRAFQVLINRRAMILEKKISVKKGKVKKCMVPAWVLRGKRCRRVHPLCCRGLREFSELYYEYELEPESGLLDQMEDWNWSIGCGRAKRQIEEVTNKNSETWMKTYSAEESCTDKWEQFGWIDWGWLREFSELYYEYELEPESKKRVRWSFLTLDVLNTV